MLIKTSRPLSEAISEFFGVHIFEMIGMKTEIRLKLVMQLFCVLCA